MGIKQVTPQIRINAMIDRDVKRMEDAVIYGLNQIGLEAYRAMRDYSGRQYQDQTGNLRSSSGYMVVKDGKIVQSGGFEVIKDGSTGSTDGKAFTYEIAPKFTTGLTLVLMAGMEYASHVEDLGYNVLDSAKLITRIMMNDLNFKLSKK